MLEPGMRHRFWAGESDFRMVVVCFDKWTAKDQVRHEDDYGRAGTALEIWFTVEVTAAYLTALTH
jgi:hypothetical protein